MGPLAAPPSQPMAQTASMGSKRERSARGGGAQLSERIRRCPSARSRAVAAQHLYERADHPPVRNAEMAEGIGTLDTDRRVRVIQAGEQRHRVRRRAGAVGRTQIAK